VLDNADGNDGKEFFTITTPDENVFYLIIDRQRGTQNVYFLNAVTEADLLSLAVMPERPAPTVVEPPPPPTVTTEPETEPPAPDNSGGSTGLLMFTLAAVLISGGAGWYFKIYRPKQQRSGGAGELDSEDYGEDDYDPYGGDEQNAEPDYDDVDWDNAGGDDTPDGDGGSLPDEPERVDGE
jgi:hypothetical protein